MAKRLKIINFMKGFFITQNIADKLGLTQSPITASLLQKTVIVITESDLQTEFINLEMNQEKLANFGKWFYENYYQNLMESFVSEND
jgi:hypothetical protein